MQKLKMLVLALLASWTVGCISVDSVVKVKPDGTGTIEQTMLINGSAMGMMSMMGGQEAGADKAAKVDPATMFSTDKLSAEAANLGEGVSFVSSTPVAQGEMKGVKAIYAFKDFNTLKVSTALPDLNEGSTQMKGKGEPLPMTLARKDGSSIITLDMLDRLKKNATTPKPEAGPAGTPEMPKEMLAMLAPMFKDMRVAISLEPQGTLVRTNATHVQGQRITLFDVAFGELFADPAGIEKLEKLGNNPSLDQIHTALKGMKGIKMNEVERLEVEFK